MPCPLTAFFGRDRRLHRLTAGLGWWLIAWLTVGVCACATTTRESSASKAVEAEPERSLTFQRGAPVPEDDALWQRAVAGDPQDLAILSQREDATHLIELAEAGGPYGAVALKALSLAPDGRMERARACALLGNVRLNERFFVLQEVQRLLAEGIQLHEELALQGADAACARQLRSIIADPAASASEKDLAHSSLTHLP